MTRRLLAALRGAAAALALVLGVLPQAAPAVPVLAPLDSLGVSRATGIAGAFSDVYEFELSERSSLTFGVSRWRLSALAITGFDVDLLALPDQSLLASGSDFSGQSPLVVSNQFFEGDLGPGLYRLVIAGVDAGGGYVGTLFVSPYIEPLAAQRSAVPAPASAALLVAGLVACAWSRRRRAGRPSAPARTAARSLP